MRSQQGPSRHSTLCLVSHLVSLSTSLRSAHVQQNCYYRTLGHATRWREEVGAMSAKRKKRAPKSGAVWRMSAKEATLAKKPHYNGYACGHGAHGDAKYSRTKSKRAWQKQLKQEGAPRGSFLFTFYLHSGCRKQRTHEPERGHTASETAAVSKGRHPICPEHEEGMQNATCACGRKRPARRANANWRIVSPPSRPNFTVRPPI